MQYAETLITEFMLLRIRRYNVSDLNAQCDFGVYFTDATRFTFSSVSVCCRLITF